MAKRKRMVNRIVKDEVASVLLDKPNSTAIELKREVEKRLKKKGYNYKFTDRTYLNIKNGLLPNLGDKPIDQPWGIGACAEYYDRISPESIPILMRVEQLKGLQTFSIRQAIWVLRLYPLIMETYNNEDEKFKEDIWAWSLVYAHMERVSELTNSKLDTSELDQELLDYLLKHANKEKGGKV